MIKSGSLKVPLNVDEHEPPPVKAANAARGPAEVVISDPDLCRLLGPLGIAPTLPTPSEEETTSQKVEYAKQQLRTLEREILSALYPSSGSPESFESLATRLGMNVKEVQKVADNALRGLRGTKGFPPRSSSAWN
jgi:hypothetical protein